jgi:anthranilate phosphoribosyltransferase
MDELSTLGESLVEEFHPDGRGERYRLAPEDLGIRRAAYADIAASGDLRRESERFLKVLAGTAHPAAIDITCLNAAAVLYVAGKTPDLQSGVERSRELIHGGRALQKLRHWVTVQADAGQNSVDRFLNIAGRAGVPDSALAPNFF